MSVLAEVVRAADPALAAHAVAGARARRASRGELDDDAGRFVLEAVYEGYLLHYGTPRAFAGMDEDLRLLAGDALYALGLARLAAAGDLRGRGGARRPDLALGAGARGGPRGARRRALGRERRGAVGGRGTGRARLGPR